MKVEVKSRLIFDFLHSWPHLAAMTTTDDTKATTKHFATSFCHKSSEKNACSIQKKHCCKFLFERERGNFLENVWSIFILSCLVYRQNLPSGSVTKMQNWFLSASIIILRFYVFFFFSFFSLMLSIFSQFCSYFPFFFLHVLSKSISRLCIETFNLVFQ